MAQTETSHREPEAFPLWFGVAGSAAAWFLHLNLIYILTPLTCRMGGRGLMLALTVLLAGFVIASGVVSWRNWRGLSRQERDDLIGNMEGTRTTFMTLGGVLASGLFLLGLALATIPIILVDPCVPVPGI